MKKTESKKSRDTVPLNDYFPQPEQMQNKYRNNEEFHSHRSTRVKNKFRKYRIIME
jgi:hypothetical protein